MITSQLIYPFPCWWTFRLLPIFCSHKYCRNERSCVCLLATDFLGHFLETDLLECRENRLFNFPRCCQIVAVLGGCPYFNFPSSEGAVIWLHTLSYTNQVCQFLHPSKGKQYYGMLLKGILWMRGIGCRSLPIHYVLGIMLSASYTFPYLGLLLTGGRI